MQKYDLSITRKGRCTDQDVGRRKRRRAICEEARKFMVKIRTLLVEGGFLVDYGWRKGLPEIIHTIGDKGEENKSFSEEVRPQANQNDVQFMRSRRGGRGTPPRDSRRGNFNCYYCKRTGHGWRECPERLCNKCGRKGHDPTDIQCPLLYRGVRYPNRYTSAREVNRVNDYDGDEKINVVAQGSIGDQEKQRYLRHQDRRS